MYLQTFSASQPPSKQKAINRKLLYDTLFLSSLEAFSYFKEKFPLLLSPDLRQSDRNYIEVKCVACFLLLKRRNDEASDLLLESLEKRFDLSQSLKQLKENH